MGTEQFQMNTIDTGWLDKLIADNVQSEKPDTILGVICGSLLIANQAINQSVQNFQSTLERGQILPVNALLTSHIVELIYDSVRYVVEVAKCGSNSFFVCMNNSYIEVDAHLLSDEGLLISLDGACHTCYLKEEV